jgi:hypothetical protein
MKWLEIIVVRTPGRPEQPIHELKKVAASLKAPGLIEAVLYNHASIPGDLALALRWDTEEPKAWGSDLGLGMMGELKHLGLVDHSVWIVASGTGGEKNLTHPLCGLSEARRKPP